LLRTKQTLEHFHGGLRAKAILPEASEMRYVKKATSRRFLRWLRCRFPKSIEHVEEDEMKRLSSSRDLILARMGTLNEYSFRTRMTQLFQARMALRQNGIEE
jgi:hypothetical protein